MDSGEPYFEAILQSIQATPRSESKFREIETTIDSWLHDDDSTTKSQNIDDENGTNNQAGGEIKDKDVPVKSSREKTLIMRLPQDMEDLINIGHNERAMEILDFVTDLNKRHGDKLAVLKEIYDKALQLRGQIVENLIKKLETIENSLDSEMHETVTLLRKCGIFTERDLRFKYLIARDSWFERNLENNANSGTFDSVVDAYEQFLPSILHDYERMFSEIGAIVPGQQHKYSSSDRNQDPGSIINSWLMLKISSFISLLQDYLTFVANNQKGVSICDTFTRCRKMTSKMGAIGFDFEPQLIPLFCGASSTIIASNIEKATVKFELAFATSVSLSIESLESRLSVASNIQESSLVQYKLDQPPSSFEDYPIFKNYCYDLLESISFFNREAMATVYLTLFVDIHKSLNSSLLRVAKALSTLSNPDYKSNHPILTRLTILYITELLPYVSSQCEKLFPEKSVLTLIGLSKLELNSLKSSQSELVEDFGINSNKIIAPLRLILPESMSIIGD